MPEETPVGAVARLHQDMPVRLVGWVEVVPQGSLAQTAAVLGDALGVKFWEDDTGTYEEFPAFCARALGCDLALLGIPDPEDYLGDEPLDTYSLNLMSSRGARGSGAGESDVDLSRHLVNYLTATSTLQCSIPDQER